jgi:hypothetical protein
MKVGDLIEIEKWCKNKGRRGIVIEAIEYMGCVKIRYLDTGEPSSALRDNLKVISESR